MKYTRKRLIDLINEHGRRLILVATNDSGVVDRVAYPQPRKKKVKASK